MKMNVWERESIGTLLMHRINTKILTWLSSLPSLSADFVLYPHTRARGVLCVFGPLNLNV